MNDSSGLWEPVFTGGWWGSPTGRKTNQKLVPMMNVGQKVRLGEVAGEGGVLSSGRVDTGTLTFKGGLGGEKEPAMCCLFPHEGIPDRGQSQRKGPGWE